MRANPWENLGCTEDGSWILPEDISAIQEFNERRTDPDRKIFLGTLPEPFIGRPDTARVVFLGLNPGHDSSDIENHNRKDFQEAIRLNLQHKLLDYPFYPLNPRFEKTGAGLWWRKQLQSLRDVTGLDWRKLSERILAIEWFPYHSKSSGLPKGQLCPSQEYAFDLARKMANRQDILVIGMKARNRWQQVLPNCSAEFLNSNQNSAVTPGNMRKGLFEIIVNRLKEDKSSSFGGSDRFESTVARKSSVECHC